MTLLAPAEAIVEIGHLDGWGSGLHGGPSGGPLFASHAMERLRILGEIPVRKAQAGGAPLLDPEGNPDQDGDRDRVRAALRRPEAQ